MFNNVQTKVCLLSALAVGMVLSISTAAQASYFSYHHPRRAEVLHRDNHERRELNYDRGRLGGHYGQLMREDRAIHAQERADARFNGGHLTRGEQRQLNHEENHLQRQINRDYR